MIPTVRAFVASRAVRVSLTPVSSAVEVWIQGAPDKLGFVARSDATTVARLIRDGYTLEARITHASVSVRALFFRCALLTRDWQGSSLGIGIHVFVPDGACEARANLKKVVSAMRTCAA